MPTSGPGVLLYEKKGRIAYLTINRPEAMNTLTVEVSTRLAEAWADFNADDNLWVAIITGTGDKAFSAGADLKEITEIGLEERRRRIWDGVAGCELEVWKPIVAAVNGFALGGGWLLAQQCDLRIAAEHAEFGIPEIRHGIAAPWVGGMLRHVGLGNALEVTLIADRISAQRAYEMGFVNKVVPREQLMPTATAWAERICQNGPLAVRAVKEVLWRGLEDLSRWETRALARRITDPVAASEDAKEGPRAFREKRKPIWKMR